MAYKFRYKEALNNAGFKNSEPPKVLKRLMEKAEQASEALENSSLKDKAGLTAILVQVDAVICAAIQREVKSLVSTRIDQSKLDAMKQLALQRKKELNKK